jgi:hypothetical protein
MGDRVRVRAVEVSGNLSTYTEVLRPNGSTLCGPNIQSDQTCLLDTDGSHTVLIWDFGGAATGSFNLYVQRLNNPVGCISFGTAVLTTAGETDCFVFNGTGGTTIRIRVIELSGNLTAYHELFRPDGTLLCGPTIVTDQTCQLELSGPHTVLVRDFGGPGTGSYQINVFYRHIYLPLIRR